MDTHLFTLTDGMLYPLTPTGTFTLKRLRLNRQPLVAYRLRAHYRTEEQRLLTRYRDLVTLLEQLHQQQLVLLKEQRTFTVRRRSLALLPPTA
jgi:hypothetical protein